MPTAIEWTEETWNPTVGCSKVSPGCDHCYAVDVAHRAMQPSHEGLTIRRPGERPDWTGEVRCLPERLQIPLKRHTPTLWFVDSMSDLFHQDVPDEFIEAVLTVMNVTPQHTYQVLTKRSQRMHSILSRVSWDCNGDVHLGRFTAAELGMPGSTWYDFSRHLPNVWWGTSIENDRYTFRARHLRATPAAVRFLSLEPLLGPLPSLDLMGIDWVIAGGESGPGARPMHPDWVRDLRDRCVAASVPFLLKQWGAWQPLGDTWRDCPIEKRWFMHRDPAVTSNPIVASTDGHNSQLRTGYEVFRKVGKKAAGRELDGRTWDEMPERTR